MLHKTSHILSAVVSGVLLLSGACYAGGVGTTGAQFLKIGSGARAAAMGGAFSAVADDLSALYWNPAGLASQKSRQATATYIKYFQGVNIGFLGYAQELCGAGTIGAGINYLTVGDIEKRTADVDASEGSFGASDMALTLSYAREKLPGVNAEGLSAGANLKIIRQTIDDESSLSYALDLGALYRTPVKNLTASAGLYNIGTPVKFVEDSDPLPLDIRVGCAYRTLHDTLLLALDFDEYLNDSRLYTQVGAEYAYRSILFLRAGYKLGMDSSALGGSTGLGTGMGIKVWNMQFDYAFVPFGELNDTHWISFTSKF